MRYADSFAHLTWRRAVWQIAMKNVIKINAVSRTLAGLIVWLNVNRAN